MFEVLSSLKYRKLNIKLDLIKYYKMMPENFYEDQCSTQAKSIYKIGLESYIFNGVLVSMSILQQCKLLRSIRKHFKML